VTLPIEQLPTVNACLNGTAAILLITGFLAIRTGKRERHRRLMEGAFAVSALFLISYLTYHALHGATRFPGHGIARSIYLTILGSHTLLAILALPLVLWTFRLAGREQFDAHKRWARWTFPIWLYVSVTGVVVYWMLYRMTWT